MKKLKVLQTPIRFYPYVGGVEFVVLNISKYIVKLGHNVDVICSNETSFEVNNYDGIRIKRLTTHFKIANTNICLGLPFEIFKSDFDIIHTHMPTPWSSDWSILIAKIKKKKSILTIHCDLQKTGFFSKLITDIYLNTIFKLSLKLVDKIIIVNPNWQETFTYTNKLLTNYIDKISFVPNGVDNIMFKPQKSSNLNKILFVSILDKDHICKGLDYLLLVVQKIKNINRNIYLEIIGEGELKEYYQNKVNELEIQNNVKFLGKKNQIELVRYYSKGSIFVLPSIDTEAFGLVLLEAMACGLPVVTTDIVGPRDDIVKYNTGIVVKPKDVNQLYNAIIFLLDNPLEAFKMGKNGEALVKSKYEWSKVSNIILSYYEQLIK